MPDQRIVGLWSDSSIVPTTSTDGRTTSTSSSMWDEGFGDFERLYQALPGTVIDAEDRLMSHRAFLALLCYRLWFSWYYMVLDI